MPRHERVQPAIVNLNVDPVEQIARVQGVGRERAEALVDYRKANGPLTNWNELRQVPGFEDEEIVEVVRREAVLS
jgi:competence ComEA-like helix-hairpin-helix protein